MVMIQASIWDIEKCSNLITTETGHTGFHKALMAEILTFDGTVALINGGNHVFTCGTTKLIMHLIFPGMVLLKTL